MTELERLLLQQLNELGRASEEREKLMTRRLDDLTKRLDTMTATSLEFQARLENMTQRLDDLTKELQS